MTQERPSAAPVVLMSCLVGMCMVVALLFVIDEPTGGHGSLHPQFESTMYQGSTGSDRLGSVRWLGLGFALLQAVFFVTCLMLGTKQRRSFLAWCLAGGFLYVASFVALAVVESIYVQGGAREIVLGLPVPTAIMIYLIGGVPVLFCIVYVWQFDRWILQDEDLQKISALAERQRELRAEDAD